MLVLVIQGVLSFNVIRLDSAYTDEALYLWTGHQEWARLIHGTPMPAFATYLSGSPVIYPIIAAGADSIGGLLAARIASLCFMLASTVLLWCTAGRLYGPKAAFFAAAFWAFLGETIALGAFATFDSMACFLLVLAAWFAVRAGQSERGPVWALLAAVALAAANCTKYATVIFDPTIVLLVLVVSLRKPLPRKEIARRSAVVISYTVIMLAVLLWLATIDNQYYFTGIAATTINRAPGMSSTMSIVNTFWPYMKVVAAIALIGVVVCMATCRGLGERLLVVLLAVTGILAPLNQIRIHTATSLGKHEDFAAWFVSIVAGYAVSAFIDGGFLRRGLALSAGLAAVVVVAAAGFPIAKAANKSWPNTSQVVAVVRPLLANAHREILFQDPSILDYYIGSEYGWDTIWESISGQYILRGSSGRTVADSPVGSGGVAIPYAAAIKAGYFKVIALHDVLNPAVDSFDAQIIPLIEHDRNYKLVGRPKNFLVWKYVSNARSHAKDVS